LKSAEIKHISKSQRRKKRRKTFFIAAGLLLITYMIFQQIILIPQKGQIREYGYRALRLEAVGHLLPEEYRVWDAQVPESVIASVKEKYEQEHRTIYAKSSPYAKMYLEFNDQLIQRQLDGEAVYRSVKMVLVKNKKVTFRGDTATLVLVTKTYYDVLNKEDGQKLDDKVKEYTQEYTIAFVKEDGIWKVYFWGPSGPV